MFALVPPEISNVPSSFPVATNSANNAAIATAVSAQPDASIYVAFCADRLVRDVQPDASIYIAFCADRLVREVQPNAAIDVAFGADRLVREVQ